MNRAEWQNGKRRVAGRWQYNWAADEFLIILDSVDRVTGRQREFVVKGDVPEWGNWKRVLQPWERELRAGSELALRAQKGVG